MMKKLQKNKQLPIFLNNAMGRKSLVKNKLIKLINRANQNINKGRFNNFSKYKQYNIYKRLNRYAQQLSLGLRWTTAGFALVFSTSLSSNAQTFTKVTTTSSPLVFHENPMENLIAGQNSHATFGDLDGDGDLDMIYGEDYVFSVVNANIYYSENIGTAANPVYNSPQSSPFGLPTIAGGSTPALVDIDGDMDLDLFTGNRNGDVILFENTGSSSSPNFSAGVFNPFGMTVPEYCYLPRTSFVDIDSDGDSDLYLIDDYGELFYFENQGVDTAANFTVRINNPFGWQAPSYSKITFGDLDKDGDEDLLVVGDTINSFYENIGDEFIPDFSLAPVQNKDNLQNISTLDTPTFVDLDGDSFLDYITGSLDGRFNFQKNDNASTPSSFQNSKAKLARESAMTFVDIDADGDLDMFSGEYDSNIYFYKNSGTPTNPSFPSTPEKNPFELTAVGSYYSSAPTFADLDGDMDLDLFAGEYNGGIYYFENTPNNGVPSFGAPVINPFNLNTTGLAQSVPTFVDIDNDQDLDAFVGAADGNIYFFENVAPIGAAPDFPVSITNFAGLSNVGSNSSISFVDIDGDQDFDAFVGESDGNVNFFENLGTNTQATFVLSPATEPFGITDIGTFSKAVFADLDGDADMDAFIGGFSGDFVFFENAVILPVELNSFEAKRINNKTLLNWQTETEQNNAGFEIQRSTDLGNNANWEIIGFIGGKGSSGQSQSYSFVDKQPKIRPNYYRLKQIDFNGLFEYSNIKVVDFSTLENEWRVFPNPVNNQLQITSNVSGEVNIQLVNALGQVVHEAHFSTGDELAIDVSNFPEGQYQLKIENSLLANSITKSIVILGK